MDETEMKNDKKRMNYRGSSKVRCSKRLLVLDGPVFSQCGFSIALSLASQRT